MSSSTFQQYFVERRHDVDVSSISFDGAATATAAPGVLDAIRDAWRVIIAPSNPFFSIDPILAVPGVTEALALREARTPLRSPRSSPGAALKGPLARLLAELGHEVSALGVARHYAAVAGTFVLDDLDVALKADVERLGMRCVVTDTVMRDAATATSLASVATDG